MVRLAVVLVVLLGVAGCASDTGQPRVEAACRVVRLARVPLDARGDMLFVHARIDGEPIKLLVDTGAERTLLTEATVDRLHLPRDFQHTTRTFGIGSPTATWDAKLPNGIELGSTDADLAGNPDFSAADGDIVYLSFASTSAKDRAPAVLDSGPWRKLSANQDNRVFVVNKEVWQTGEGVVAARGVVEDLRFVNAPIN